MDEKQPPCAQRWMPRFIGTLLFLMYSRAIFYDPTVFVGQLCALCPFAKEDGDGSGKGGHHIHAGPHMHGNEDSDDHDHDGEDTPADVWKDTPTQIKGAVYQTGGWAAAFGVMVVWLSLQERGHSGLCKACCFAFLNWQFWWYARIQPTGNVPFANLFLKESLQEIIFSLGFGYLGFVVPKSDKKTVRGQGTTAKVRLGLLCFVCTLLSVMQCAAYFNPAMYTSMEKGMVDPKGQDDQAVWDGTPLHSKIMTLEQAGWVTCLTCVMLSMLLFEPGCDRYLCIGMALVMIWWNFVWYLGVLGHVDVDGDYTVHWSDLAKNEATFEIPFILIFGYLGTTTDGMEEERPDSRDFDRVKQQE